MLAFTGVYETRAWSETPSNGGYIPFACVSNKFTGETRVYIGQPEEVTRKIIDTTQETR